MLFSCLFLFLFSLSLSLSASVLYFHASATAGSLIDDGSSGVCALTENFQTVSNSSSRSHDCHDARRFQSQPISSLAAVTEPGRKKGLKNTEELCDVVYV